MTDRVEKFVRFWGEKDVVFSGSGVFMSVF